MEQNDTQKVITFAELWEVFVDHVWMIVIVGLLAFGLITGYSVITYRAEYTSTSTVYLLQQKDNGGTASTNTPTSSDFSLALSTVNDCTRTFKSHRVLDAVITQLGMPVSYAQLSDMITINNPTSTRFLEISVTANNPQDAKIIVDKLCEIGAQTVVDVMGIDQVNIVDKGTLNENPSNSMITILNFAVGIGAAVAVYIIYLLAYMLDDRIGTPDDIQKYLNLAVLGLIPNALEASGRKYGKYGKYGRYSSYGKYATYAADNGRSENK